MKSKIINFETVFLLIISGGLFLLSVPDIQLKILPAIIHSFRWQDRIFVLSQIFAIYGFLLLILSILSYFSFSQGRPLFSQVIRHGKDLIQFVREELIQAIKNCFTSKYDFRWLVMAMMIAIGVRGFFLSQPMRYDESLTFIRFVNKSFFDLFSYPFPNNHVLYTILVKISTFIFGNQPVAIRLPAFFAGILTIPLFFCLCRSLRISGYFAAVSAAVFPYLILYSANGRGYSLLVLLTILLAFVGVQISKKGASVAGDIILAAIASLGLLTIPTMVFPIAGIFLWIFCLHLINGQSLKTVLLKFVIPTGIMTIIFTFILYTPVIIVTNGIEPIIGNNWVKSLPWQIFFRKIYPQLFFTARDFLRFIPGAQKYVSLILLILGIAGSFRKRNWALLLILPLIMLCSLIVLFIQHAIPFSRTWIFIIPFILLYVEAGFTYFIENIPVKIKYLSIGLTYAAGAIIAISLISTNAITQNNETGNFPEAQVVATFLAPIVNRQDVIISKTPANFPVYFYLWYSHANFNNAAKRSETGRAYFIVQKSAFSLEEITTEPVIQLLDLGDAAVYQSVDVGAK